MLEKVLIAMDDSENALKAVRYAAVIIAGKIQQTNTQITLFHVFYKAPYEEIAKSSDLPHHDLSFSGSTGEFKQWMKNQRDSAEKGLEHGRQILVNEGIPNENIEVKVVENKKGQAAEILNELERVGYDTIVVGRRGATGVKRFFTGSITSKIVNHARDCAVWVVE